MSSTNDISVAPAESAEAKRVRRLQRRRERERARRASETAEQREERLSKRIRDRVTCRREAQSVEQRQTLFIPFCTRSGSPQTMFCMSLVIYIWIASVQLVYVGLAQARPNYSDFLTVTISVGLAQACPNYVKITYYCMHGIMRTRLSLTVHIHI